MTNQDSAPVVYTREECAEKLKVSVSTVGRLIRSGELYSFRAGRALRVPREALEHFAHQRAYEMTNQPKDMPDFQTWPPTPSIFGEES